MQEAILVPVDPCDPVEQIVPWVESIAKPGMRVVFLVRSVAGNWERLNAHITAIQTGNVITLQTCGARERAELEQEKQSAEAKLAVVSEDLRQKGLETEVRIYAGGLRKTLASLDKSENVRFLLMPTGGASPVARGIQRIVRLFNPVTPPRLSPLLLINLGTGIARSK